MEKTFVINGRTYVVVSKHSNDDSYRLVYLSNPDDNPNGLGAKVILDDSACEDFYGDIDTVADIMEEYIREEAEKPYPWWTLFNTVYEWGSDSMIIEDEESARSFADVLDGATIMGSVDMADEYEVECAKTNLDLEDATVFAIHTFVNGSAGSFCLSEDWI